MTLTKEWLQHTIAELEEERDAVPGVVNEDAARALAAMKLALASLEAEAVGEVSEQRDGLVMDGTVDLGGASTHRIIKGASKMKRLPLGTKFYTAPPAPVSVPEEITFEKIAEITASQGYEYSINECICAASWWNACRAAMLQGAEPVTTGYKLRDAVDAIRNSGIAIDGEKILAERDALNSPEIPDDVRRMDWLVSKTVDVREPMVYGSHSLFWSQTITDEEDDYHATKLREQIDAAMAAEQAAAPQQEVK